MANLNLSEFTEKLFVADADHTFIWDSAVSISKRVSRNSWLNSGTLTSDAPVTISQTWGTTGIYTAFKVVATETAVANTLSNVLELWSGNAATLKLSIRKSGQIVGPSGTIAAPTYGFADTDWGTGFSGWYRLGTGVACSTAGGTISAFSITHTNIRIGSSIPFGWTSGTAENALDTILVRDGAPNTLALRNGAAAQTFNVYGTYTSGTSYERLTLSAPSAANAIIGTNKGSGGGTARGLEFQTDGAARMTISTAGNVGIGTTAPSQKLNVVGTSQFQSLAYFTQATPNTTLVIDSSTSPHKIYTDGNTDLCLQTVAGSRNVGIGTTSPTSKLEVAGAVLVTGGTVTVNASGVGGPNNGTLAIGAGRFIYSSGKFLLDDGNGTSAFVALGSATNANAAFKKTTGSVRIQAVLGNDSGFTNIQGKLTTDTDYTATVVTPTGFLTLYDAQGTAYRVPCVLAP